MLIAQAATAQAGGFPDRLPQEYLQSELEGQDQNEIVLGWCNVQESRTLSATGDKDG